MTTENPMSKYPPRPKVTPEIILKASKAVAKSMGATDAEVESWTECIAEAYGMASGGDSFSIAKVLDYMGWEITASDVEELDSLEWSIDRAVEQLARQWVEENNIQPPLPVGTELENGIIKGVYDRRAGRYLVKENGCTNDGRHLLIKFEDARAKQ